MTIGAVGVDPRITGLLGSTAASVRQLVTLAMVLMLGVDTVLLNWASPVISSSAIGSALVAAWRVVFAA